MYHTISLLTGFALLTLATTNLAYAEATKASPTSVLLKNANSQYNQWNGIGKLHWNGQPYCTASLLDTRDENNTATGPAYLLTADHCVHFWGQELKDPSSISVKFNYFNDTHEQQNSYKVNSVSWGRRPAMDLAVLELGVPLSTLLRDGITALKISEDAGALTGEILIVGAPQGDLSDPGLRLATCTQQKTAAALVEGRDVYPDTRKNDCPDQRPGASGSPVLDPATGKIDAVLITSTRGATLGNICSDNNPCEVQGTHAVLQDETHYSSPVDAIWACFANGRFDLKSDRCTLSARTGFKLKNDHLPEKFRAPQSPDAKAPNWNIRFTMDAPYYRFKTVRDAQSCYAPHDYSGIRSTANALINEPIGREEGMYFLCLLGVQSADHRPDTRLFNSLKIFPAGLIKKPFKRLPQPTLTFHPTRDNQYVSVLWHEDSSRPFWTRAFDGDMAGRTCAELDPSEFYRTENGVIARTDTLPQLICSYIEDGDLNRSEVSTDVIPAPTIITNPAP
jgi:hypothetical protein